MGELWALPIMLRLGLLERLLAAIIRLTGLAAQVITEIATVSKTFEQPDDQLTVENGIRSLRTLAICDWKSFFETLSLVDVTLRQDPARLYLGMDFETRDRYRKAVEEIANFGQGDELAVAQWAVSLARDEGDQLTLHPKLTSQESLDSYKYQGLKDQPDGWDGFLSEIANGRTDSKLLARENQLSPEIDVHDPQILRFGERKINYPGAHRQ